MVVLTSSVAGLVLGGRLRYLVADSGTPQPVVDCSSSVGTNFIRSCNVKFCGGSYSTTYSTDASLDQCNTCFNGWCTANPGSSYCIGGSTRSNCPAPAPSPCEVHDGISGANWPAGTSEMNSTTGDPTYPGLKLADGTDASETWYKPYQNHVLSEDLREWDCNPAKCSNDARCGIPVCRGMSYNWEEPCRHVKEVAYCNSAGCNAEQHAQLVKSTFPNASNVQPLLSGATRASCNTAMSATDAFPQQFLPGIRFGYYTRPSTDTGGLTWLPSGAVYLTPYSTDAATAPGGTVRDGDGAYMRPDRRVCNPLKWLVSSKTAIAQTAVPKETKSALLMTKLSICLKANCTNAAGNAVANCPSLKCYSYKQGECIKTTADIMPTWQDTVSATHISASWNKFNSGDYTACDAHVQHSCQGVIAGN